MSITKPSQVVEQGRYLHRCSDRAPEADAMHLRFRLPHLIIAACLAALLGPSPQAQATTVTYINSPISKSGEFVPTGFQQNDILASPAGVFNGVVQNDGNFTVFYGPPQSQAPVLWSCCRSNPGGGPYKLVYSFNSAIPIVYYGVASASSSSTYGLIAAQTPPAQNFLALNDNGTLSIYSGANGRATGAALATIGKAASFNDLTVTSVVYDLSKATYPEVSRVFGTTQKLINSTKSEGNLTAHLSLAYADSQSYDWNTSKTVSGTISTTNSIKVPIIGATELSLELSRSTTISEGKSTTSGTETTYLSEVTLPVPGGVTYGVDIYGTQQEALVPFTYSGFDHFADGISVPVTGSGEFEGVSTGIFESHAYCISPASFCDTAAANIPDEPALPVPEPSSFATLLTGMCALGGLYYLRKGRSLHEGRAAVNAPAGTA
jgi:hypothetical protein